MADNIPLESPELTQLINNKESGYNYRERRHDDWDENYALYRDKVNINRLTQRQSVHLPLMKQTIRTLLKDVDDMPVLYFENLDNDKEAEVFKNSYWEWTSEENNMELQDIVDKKQVFLYGRTFDQMQIIDGKIVMTVQDPMDMLVDRYCDPTNIDSSRFLIHTHIFKPLTYLINNPLYDQAEVQKLVAFYKTAEGLIKASDNLQMLQEKNQKLQDLGVTDVDEPILGETYVEISLHYLWKKDKDDDDEEQIYLYTEADNYALLSKKPLEEVIGVTPDGFWRKHYPYTTWADDIERQDFWSDSVGDIVRTPNKVLDAWFSQMVENRTLRNFGMHYYDSSNESYTPGTFNPIPWGWYPVPGKPSEVLQKVDIPDLSESLDEISFVIGTVEKATGATATQQGAQTERKITLGEVELALGEAKERIKGMSKFYTHAWKRRGMLFSKLIEAAPGKINAVKIYKKGRNSDDIYNREISPKDYLTESGYRCKVWSKEEKMQQSIQQLEKLNAVKVNMPDNPKLDEIYKRKLVEFIDLSPDEVNEIMNWEKQKREMQAQMMQQGAQAGMMPNGQPQLGAPQPQRMVPTGQA